MTAPLTGEALRAWAHTVGSLALAKMAEDMPGVRAAKKPQVIDWLMENEPEILAESYRLSHPNQEH